MAGVPYDGGGIGVSVAATRAASDDELRALLRARVAEMRALGTTTVEVKSGYGLTVDDEVRALRLAREVTDETTFLGAHVVPPEARDDRAAYLDLVCGPMLAACAPHARWVDVFCEPASPHAFTERRGARACSRPAGTPGSACACTATSSRPGRGCGSRSSSGPPASTTARSSPTPTSTRSSGPPARRWRPCCPGVEFSTRSPYPDARRLLDAGVDVALATDCNPGTCNTASMPFVVALAVREMRMTRGRGPGRGHRGRCPGAAPHRRRAGGRGVARRPRRARRAVVRAPGLPARDAARPRPRLA